jgi:hypothetical protein
MSYLAKRKCCLVIRFVQECFIKKKLHLNHLYFLLLSIFIFINNGFTQSKPADTSSLKVIIAGPEYKKPAFYQKLWGYNRRMEWTTPIRVPVLWIDNIHGGLKPYKTGGGNETKSLRLKTADGKQYSLRSINKSRADVVLPAFKHTFIEDIINDGISMSYPYGSLAVPAMEESAGIYHTNPTIVYLPQQAALDTFNKKFSDNLYLFEQRLDGDWSDSDNLGNFKNFTSTYEVIYKLKEDNNNKADQHAFVKARLFDMLISDWDRHEDQWQWGSTDTTKLFFKPVPRDRDQAFFTHKGILIDLMLPAAGLSYMQNFDYDAKEIKALNFEERNIDRFFTNEISLNDWVTEATNLQQSLTDSVIERSIQQLPPEIFSLSGAELIAKLKSRRNHLVTYATDYYLFLAKEADITGSRKREYFEVNSENTSKTSLRIFSIDDEGKKNDTAFYSRIFSSTETKEIRLYGLAGEDKYLITGNKSPIKIRIIGGTEKDSVIQYAGTNRIHIYDDANNDFTTTNAKLHLSADSTIHTFDYENHNYNKKGLRTSFFYNNEERLYVGLGYGFTKYKWRRYPYATKQFIGLNYSLSQKAISAAYTAEFPNIIHGWNFLLSGIYDAVRWTNFFGHGNETVLTTNNKNYYRMRTVEWMANASIKKKFKNNTILISTFFQSAKILSDTDRYVAKLFLPGNEDAFERNNYAGAQFTYTFLKINDSIVPTSGFTFLGSAAYFSNIAQKEFFQKYFGKMQAYLPIGDKFSLAIRAGAATILNSDVMSSAEFYEHAIIGGAENLRGFKRERFWGKTSFYNNNELRFISNIKTHLLNAKAGLLIFFDDGRVWMPHENSNTLHYGYGTGILLAPFNKVSGTFTYGISKESRLFQIRLNKLF